MKIFACTRCRNTVFFENVQCLHCQSALGYHPDRGMLALPQADLHPCRNQTEFNVCNWLTRQPGQLCRACRLNRTVPDDTSRWYRLEAAKKRLIYSLLQLGLSLEGLKFDFLLPAEQPVLTGYANGLITINANEADDPAREQMRVDMNEPYRTLVGHFRHESGHHYWHVLVRDLARFRQLFGDEREDYQAALQRHYDRGAPDDWLERGHISAYASMHPSEDWAETWAHYLHMRDTLETAREFGLGRPGLDSFEELAQDWGRLTFALNSINRSMGISDLYPFVLSPKVLEKLAWIHHLVL
ncbi:MAG: putative zinc-binding metallopeptidase [Vulcanimicrobiota bacterium]